MSIAHFRRWYALFSYIRFARVSSYVVDFHTRNKRLTPKLLNQSYQYPKLHKTFFLNFIADTRIWYLNSMLDLNLFRTR